jgi:maltose alpha-D-glucosyltransferase/alpha-amylase
VSWYRSAVFYEVLPRSFRDSDGDGIGDLGGIAESLEYLEWLGIDCIWIPPFFESPLRDGGYDVSDYRKVRGDVGTMDDLADLIDAAHRRRIRVISDVVMNHTSDAHAWFQEARRPDSDQRDWYVWSDTNTRYSEARIIFTDSEDSNWAWDETAGAYYWHRFYRHQPDLNYDNPEVRREMLDVFRFWLDLGFDGFRMDAVPYLFEREGTNCENLPETHDYLRRVRAMVDREYDDRVLLAEANQWPRDAAAYFGDGDECHMNFHFPVMPRLFMGLARGNGNDLRAILADTPSTPKGAQWGIFLRNHDELTLEMVTPEERDFMWSHYAPEPRHRLNLGIRRRLAPLAGNDRKSIELLHGLLLSLPGSPVLYYGDEIGMGDNVDLPDRDGVRTPMQWTRDGGFTEARKSAYLPMITGPDYGPEAVNVEDQMADPGSLLTWIRDMLAARRRRPEMGPGSFDMIDHPNDAVVAFLREHEGRATLVLANFAADPQAVSLPADRLGGLVVVDAISGEPLEGITVDPFTFDLGPLEFRWFELQSVA